MKGYVFMPWRDNSFLLLNADANANDSY